MASAAGAPPCRERGAGSWLGPGPCFWRLPWRGALILGAVEADERTGVTEGHVSWGQQRSPFSTKFPLGPEPGLPVDSWLGAGVLCFVLGRAWRPLPAAGRGSGWWEGRGLLHASTVPAPCTVLASKGDLVCHYSLASPGGRTPLVPMGALPQGRWRETACAQLTRWGPETHLGIGPGIGVWVASVGTVLCNALPLALRESSFL